MLPAFMEPSQLEAESLQASWKLKRHLRSVIFEASSSLLAFGVDLIDFCD
jgi:hypothetical protein